MNDINEEIKQLSETITELKVYIVEIDKNFEEFKTQSSLAQATIDKQKKELKDLEKKLFECSNGRDEIQGKLDKKVTELEKSNLTKEQIAEQTIHLLTKSGFVEVRDKLMRV